MRRTLLVSALALTLIPVTALALEGTGPRVTITGTVKEVTITDKQKFDEEGGQVTVTATNGQDVTVVFTKDTQFISEGRLSRKQLIPANIIPGMQVRVRGLRIDSKSLTASLAIVLNIEVNPTFSGNGTVQAISNNMITVLAQDGQSRTFQLTNETEVNLTYTSYGAQGLSLIGKKILLTLNPSDPTKVRIFRITGDADATAAQRPASIR